MKKRKHGLPGMQYGSLIVLCEADPVITGTGKMRRMVRAKCLGVTPNGICNVEDIYWLEALYGGHTTSCGCSRLTMSRIEATASSVIRCTACYHDIWTDIQGNPSQLRLWMDIAECRCFYCKKKPLQVQKGRKDRGEAADVDWIHNGWDAVDPTKGHTLDNVVACCKECNRAKNDLLLNDFSEHIRRMYDYRLTAYNSQYSHDLVVADKISQYGSCTKLSFSNTQSIIQSVRLEIGAVIGKLTLLETVRCTSPSQVATKKFNTMWKCRCECDRETLVMPKNLLNGLAQSCGKDGCYPRKHTPLSSAIASRYQVLQYQDHKKGRKTLSLEQFSALIFLNCVYCGSLPTNNMRDYVSGKTFRYNGLDRIDSNGGHTEDNSVPCCENCNHLKGELSISDLNQYLTTLFTCSLDWKYTHK